MRVPLLLLVPLLFCVSASAQDKAQNAKAPENVQKTASQPDARATAIRAAIERVRAVMRALAEVAPIKAAYAEFWVENRKVPANLAQLGHPDPLHLRDGSVSLDQGTIVISFHGEPVEGRLALMPWLAADSEDTVHWSCGLSEPPAEARPLTAIRASSLTSLRSGLPNSCQ